MTTAAVETRGLQKSFTDHHVLRGVDLAVPRGSVCALLGSNGAGKTTIIRILATLLKPDAGSATVAGHDVVREAQRVREAISLTGQFAAGDEILTGRENLRLIARLRHLPHSDRVADGGKTILLTTQYPEEAEQLADRIAILHRGRFIADDTLAGLKALLPPARREYVVKQPSLEDIFLALVGDPASGRVPDTAPPGVPADNDAAAADASRTRTEPRR